MTPLVSHKIAFSAGSPMALISSRQAMPAEPAPLTAILMSLMSRPVRCNALISPAAQIMAVPCWSSWKTGISINSRNCCSMIKQSGARISSRLMPPNDGPKCLTASMKAVGSSVSTSRSIESTSAKRLNKTALPSITGLAARAPRFPSPKMAVPLEITATILPREV